MIFNPNSDNSFCPWGSSARFHDRLQAADQLVKQLSEYQGKNPLVLGIPRGSVPMAKKIADELGGELDVVLVHKIGAPDNPEFAIGSVSEFGELYRSDTLGGFGIPRGYIESVAQSEIAKLKARRSNYSPIRPPINPQGRTVIIVDDGIATGATVLAAIRAIRSQHPKKIIIAAPIASPRTVDRLRSEVEDLIVLETPLDFFSISQFYDEFPQVTDEEVLQALAESQSSRGEPQRIAS